MDAERRRDLLQTLLIGKLTETFNKYLLVWKDIRNCKEYSVLLGRAGLANIIIDTFNVKGGIDLGWRLNLLTWPNDIRIAMTWTVDSVIMRQAHRQGFNVITVGFKASLSDSEYSFDLRKDEIDALISKYPLMWGGSQILHIEADARAFGRFVRTQVYNVVSRGGLRYVGLGDEIESVSMFRNMPNLFINDSLPSPPLGYPQWPLADALPVLDNIQVLRWNKGIDSRLITTNPGRSSNDIVVVPSACGVGFGIPGSEHWSYILTERIWETVTYDTMDPGSDRRFDSMSVKEALVMVDGQTGPSNDVTWPIMAASFTLSSRWIWNTKTRSGMSVNQAADELGYGDVLGISQVEEIYSKCGYASFFPYTLVNSCKKYLGNNIIDPFFGWGDRAAACSYLGKSYTGYDIGAHAVHISSNLTRQGLHHTLIEGNSEDAEIFGTYDSLITSPPFFDQERYEGVNYPSGDEGGWVRSWLVPLLTRFIKHVKIGGYVALHIPNRWIVPMLFLDEIDRIYVNEGDSVRIYRHIRVEGDLIIPPKRFVIASSGSGKSYFVDRHEWAVDLDKLVTLHIGWPTVSRWWKQDALRNEMNQRIYRFFRSYSTDKVIFGAVADVSQLINSNDQVVVVNVRDEEHKRRLELRDPQSGQPLVSDWSSISDHKRNILEWANRNDITVVSDFTRVSPDIFPSIGERALKIPSGSVAQHYMVRRDFLSYRYDQGDLPVSLFAISNVRNSKSRVFTFLKSLGRFIILVPHRRFAHIAANQGLVDVDGDVMTQTVNDEIFRDNLYTPEEFLDMEGVNTWSIQDFYTLCSFTEEGEKIGGLTSSWVSNSWLNHLWFVVSKGVADIVGANTELQTWRNSQTHHIKTVSLLLRRVYNLDNTSLHETRAAVVEEVMRGFPFNVKQLSGFINYNGKIRGVAVAGHLINMLIWSGNSIVDFRRYMMTIESNVRLAAARDKRVSKLIKQYGVSHLLVETFDENVLWHSYFDWMGALFAYERYAERFSIELNLPAVEFCRKRLNEIATEVPNFLVLEGLEATEYRKRSVSFIPSQVEKVDLSRFGLRIK